MDYTSEGWVDATALPVAGTYTVRIDPQGWQTGSVDMSLYDATLITGPITAGGQAIPVSLNNPGQNGNQPKDGSGQQPGAGGQPGEGSQPGGSQMAGNGSGC